jgi:hypothetical protein
VHAPPEPRRPRLDERDALAKLVGSAKTKGRVSIVGRSREKIAQELTGRLGMKRASALMRKIAAYKKLVRAPHSKVVVMTKGAQTPKTIGLLAAKRGLGAPVSVLHGGRVHRVG